MRTGKLIEWLRHWHEIALAYEDNEAMLTEESAKEQTKVYREIRRIICESDTRDKRTDER